MIRVFIGYDEKEKEAYNVLAYSIMRRSSEPVSITPLYRPNLPIFTRPRGEFDSTDFSNSRFIVPYLCGYEGHAIFMDCDMLMLDDIAELWALRGNETKVVKHDYTPSIETKFLGQIQTKYTKKNWSSLMLFNNEQCRFLTPKYVNMAPGLDLHQFKWADSIGELPNKWNWLVDVYQGLPEKGLLHYTNGGPWFKDTHDCTGAQLWFDERTHSTT